MKISIIIPCYNCEKYINECLESVLSVISQDDEVICVDDGSTDSTPMLLNAISDNRVKVITQHNMGPGAARNAGIEAAIGDQILFVDSDDIVSKPLIDIVKAKSEDVLRHRQLCMQITKNKNKLENDSSEFVGQSDKHIILSAKEVKLDILDADLPTARKIYEKGYDICGPVVKTYCREILNKYQIRYPDKLRWGEDICFNLQYLSHIDEVYFVPVKSYWYRTVSGSLMNSYYHDKHLEILYFLEFVNSLLSDDEEKKAFHFMEVKQYIFILRTEYCNLLNRESFAIRRQKAWNLKNENYMLREGIKSYNLFSANINVAITVFLIRMNLFAPVDLSIKLYTAFMSKK